MMDTDMILPWWGLKSSEEAHSKQQATQLQVKLRFNDKNAMIICECTLKDRQTRPALSEDVFMERTS